MCEILKFLGTKVSFLLFFGSDLLKVLKSFDTWKREKTDPETSDEMCNTGHAP